MRLHSLDILKDTDQLHRP